MADTLLLHILPMLIFCTYHTHALTVIPMLHSLLKCVTFKFLLGTSILIEFILIHNDHKQYNNYQQNTFKFIQVQCIEKKTETNKIE